MANVLGWNDPHYFRGKQRISLSKDEAHQMALDYYRVLLRNSFGLQIKQVKSTPCTPGEFTRTRQVSVSGAPHTYVLKFYVGGNQPGLIEIRFDIPAPSSGVGTRELFRILTQWLNGEDLWFADLAEGSLMFTTETTYLATLAQKRTQIQEAILGMDLTQFGEYIQKKFKRSISFQAGTAEHAYCQVMTCPWTNGTVRTFAGHGATKQDAKNHALQQAIQALVEAIR